VSDKHQLKISVRGSDGLPGWRKLRRSSVVASSLSKSKPWSKTLLEVATSGKRGRRASRGDGERVTNEPDETVFLGTVTRIDNLGEMPSAELIPELFHGEGRLRFMVARRVRPAEADLGDAGQGHS
jgi:hypothetical protein